MFFFLFCFIMFWGMLFHLGFQMYCHKIFMLFSCFVYLSYVYSYVPFSCPIFLFVPSLSQSWQKMFLWKHLRKSSFALLVYFICSFHLLSILLISILIFIISFLLLPEIYFIFILFLMSLFGLLAHYFSVTKVTKEKLFILSNIIRRCSNFTS